MEEIGLKLIKGIPMNRFPYKIFLDRYAQKDLSKPNIKQGVKGTVVVATTDKSDPKYPQKEICTLEEVLDEGYYRVKNIFDDLEEYKLHINDLTEPTELYPEQIWSRIADAMECFESVQYKDDNKDGTYKAYYKLLENWKFVPAGRILASVGTEFQNKLTPFNCYVVPYPKDSRKGATDILQTMIEIMSRGGGVGINLSSLRPRHAPVYGVNGTSSGAVSWGGGYSYYTGLIEQGGSRRGALMLGLAVWHPDILEFIESKTQAGKIENANISVFITDDFMEAVEKDEMWKLEFPDISFVNYDDEWDGDLNHWKLKGYPVKTYKVLPARELWNKIITSAWKSAEPGIVWMDRYNKLSNTWYYEDIIGVNPCLTGDTLIHTTNGLKRMKELYETQEEFKVIVDSRLGNMQSTTASKVFKTGTKQVYKLVTNEGYEVRLTGDHKVLTTTGWKQAKDLSTGDKILVGDTGIFNRSNDKQQYNIGLCLGWLIGDGWINQSDKTVYLGFYGPKREISHYFKTACDELNSTVEGNYSNNLRSSKTKDVEILSSTMLYYWISRYGITNTQNKKQIPDFIFRSSADAKIGFLKALFSADGHIESGKGSRHAIVLTSNDYSLLQDTQVLLNSLGIYSTVYANRTKEKTKLMPDGHGGYKEYHCKSCHDIRITGQDLIKFYEYIGFLQSDKNAKLKSIVESYTRGPYKKQHVATFKELIEDGIEDVYDMQVPGVNAFIANGLVVHNCGEQGLPAYGVCNLGHINLSRILLDPNQHYGINWEDLRNTIHQAIRFMDNIIDMAFYFLPDNEKAQKQSRRIGLGTMGLAELMIKLGIKYGSKTSLDFIDALYSFIRNEAYLASSLLAKERGSFPAFDAEKYLKGKFIEQLPEEIKACIRKHGIRNATLLTQAPTGTVGTMIETSTGIEPFFQWKYLRKCRLGNDIRYEPVAFRYIVEHNLKDESELPSYFVTAMELTPEEHTKVMASVQRYVDSSISKTVNCPADWSIEQVDELYKMAYNLGCKGITIYRDGSRDTQVLNRIEDNPESSSGSKDNPESLPDPLEAELPEFKWGDSLPVPEDTVYKKVKLNTGCGKIILMVGWSESLNKVIDVYTIVNSTGGCQLNIQGLAITISQYLRLGGNINKLLEKSKEAGNCGSYQFKRGQGQKDLCGKSCFNGIVKTIAEFKPQGSPSLVQNLSEEDLNSVEYEQKGIEQTLVECPSCKRHTLRKTEGCYSCTYCGYSKCE
jgi:ribonucleoside-diphosphate reductase alpha chain